MLGTKLLTPFVFQNLKTGYSSWMCTLGNSVEISASRLAAEIPNLVNEDCALNADNHAGRTAGAQVWKLKYRDSLPFYVKISPPTSKKMREGTYLGQSETFIANNRNAQAAERFARDDQATATAIQKNTGVSAEILEVVKSTKTDQQEQAKTQAVVMQEISVGLKQLQARASQLCQVSGERTNPATGITS
jgi:hypothetical protein